MDGSTYLWRPGFHAPSGVAPDQVAAAIENLDDRTPEALLEASSKKRHVLNKELWSESDSTWAERGRIVRCREIIRGIEIVSIVGGVTLETRAFEHVTINGGGQYMPIDEIARDEDLVDQLLQVVIEELAQTQAKLERIRGIKIGARQAVMVVQDVGMHPAH